jgi:hypothetical protein
VKPGNVNPPDIGDAARANLRVNVDVQEKFVFVMGSGLAFRGDVSVHEFVSDFTKRPNTARSSPFLDWISALLDRAQELFRLSRPCSLMAMRRD